MPEHRTPARKSERRRVMPLTSTQTEAFYREFGGLYGFVATENGYQHAYGRTDWAPSTAPQPKR